MVSREEPRMTQVDQGIDILDKNQPIYNLKDQDFTIGFSASIWVQDVNELGNFVFRQEYIDFSRFAVVYTSRYTAEEGAKILEPSACNVFDLSLADKLSKALCIPQKEEQQVFGNPFSAGFGSIVNLVIRPKCNTLNEEFEFIPCSPEELSEFDTLFNSESVPGIAFEVFSLELQLDYTDFEKPLKLKQKVIYETLLQFDSSKIDYESFEFGFSGFRKEVSVFAKVNDATLIDNPWQNPFNEDITLQK